MAVPPLLDIPSLKEYINEWIRNDATPAFQSLRMNTALLSMADLMVSGGGTADGNNYSTGLTFAGQVLTITRVGLSSLTATINKSTINLGNVDNTSDATKWAASATLTNKSLDGGFNTFTNISVSSLVPGTNGYVLTTVGGATVWAPDSSSALPLGGTINQVLAKQSGSDGDADWETVDKTFVGLPNVDDTADLNKPISTATQTALNLKANIASPTFTGVPAGPTASGGTNTTQLATTAFVTAAVAAATTGVSSFAGRTGAVVPVTNDYTFAQIDKTVSSLADLTTRSAGHLSSGTLLDARLSTNVVMLTGAQTLTDKTLTAPIINVGSDATADIYFRNASGLFSRLPIGTNGHVLTVVAGLPAYVAPSGGSPSDGDKGDITVSSAGAVWTIDNGVVTLTKQADIATNVIMGRVTAGTGIQETLSPSIVKTMLNLTGTNSGDVTYTGESYITLAGQALTGGSVNLGSSHASGTISKDRFAGSQTEGFVVKLVSGVPTWQVETGTGGGVASVSGTTNRITSTGGAAPAIDISSSYVGQSSITTLGTIGTGVWQGSAITNTFITSIAWSKVTATPTTVSGYGLTDAATLTTSQTLSNKTIASPSLTGIPAAPTAAPGTNTTQVATTAFVTAAVSAATAGVASFNGRTGTVVSITNDYTWAQIDKGTSSFADITTRSATDINSGTLNDLRLSSNVPLKNIANTFSADLSVPDEAYGISWNSSMEVPTKNSLYDKIETIFGSSPFVSAVGPVDINPNANGSLITGNVLYLEPSSYQFPGVLTVANHVRFDNKTPYWPMNIVRSRETTGLPPMLNSAVDVSNSTDYNAWPTINKDRRGRLHIYYIMSPSGHDIVLDHVLKQAISGDGGLTWTTVTITTPLPVCNEVHSLLLSNGKIGLAISCNNASYTTQKDYYFESDDDGETFSTAVLIRDSEPSGGGPLLTSFMEDRNIFYITSQAKLGSDTTFSTILYKSFDWGRTWTNSTVIATDAGLVNFNESRIVRYGDIFVCFVRDETNQKLWRTTSSNLGVSWTTRVDVTPPAWALSEPDPIVIGNILHLFYRGGGALVRAISYDGGLTWDDWEVVDTTAGGGASQYSKTIYEDGLLITAFGMDVGSGLVDSRIRLITHNLGFAVGLDGVASTGSGGGGGLSGLTAGRVIFATSGSTVGDAAEFTYDNTDKVLKNVRTSGTAGLWVMGGAGATDEAYMLFGQSTSANLLIEKLSNAFAAYGLTAGSAVFYSEGKDIVSSTAYISGAYRQDLKISGSGGSLYAKSLDDATGSAKKVISTNGVLSLTPGDVVGNADNRLITGSAFGDRLNAEADILYDGTTFSIQTSNNAGFKLKEYNANYYGIWGYNISPSTSNYAFMARRDGTESYLNSTSSVGIGINDAAVLSVTAGLVTVPLIKITGGSPGAGKVLTSDADGDATWQAPASTFQQILTNGAILTGNNTITGGAFTLAITSSETVNDGAFSATNTSSGAGLVGISNSGVGTYGTSTSGPGGVFISGSSTAITAITQTGVAGNLSINPATTNTAPPVLLLQRSTSGTAANGIGLYIDMSIETTDGTIQTANSIQSMLTNATTASYVSDLLIYGVDNAVNQILLTLKGDGRLQLHRYNSLTAYADETAAAAASLPQNTIYRDTAGILRIKL